MALLKKMQMPKSRKDEMDLSELADVSMDKKKKKDPMDDQADEPDMDDAEMDADADMEMADDNMAHEADPLGDVADEDLVAEIKKRGLMKKLDEKDADAEDDQDLSMGMY